MVFDGTVGLGVTTWKRPEMYARCRDSILDELGGLVDHVYVVQDGGDPYVFPAPEGWTVVSHGDNVGWAQSKNECLNHLYEVGCDYLFMIEDDTTVTSPQAITGYIAAHEANGHHYMTAHPWGQTTTTLVETDGAVSYWAYVGSWWTFMTRHGWEQGGPYNEIMGGIMGDIEIVQRWKLKGLTSGWGRIPDATGSEAWVRPDCLTPDQSTICTQDGWLARQEWLIRWWQETMPETMPAEMRPATEGKASKMCDDRKHRLSAASIEPRPI
jgi:hypothetical protein